MQTLKTTVVITGLAAMLGCSSPLVKPGSYITQPEVCIEQKWYGYHQGSGCPSTTKAVAPDASQEMAARLAALERDRQRLADELEAARKQNRTLSGRVSDLERQLADRDRELAALRSGAGDSARLASQLAAAQSDLSRAQGDKDKLAAELATAKQRIAELEAQLSQSKGDLAKAEKDLLKALRPEIARGTVSVSHVGDALTINLASSLLFDSGQDQLKAGGTDALKRVGNVLKDFPEKEVHVAGYTDNVAIKSALKKKYPTNKELSDARANSAAQALRDGGVSSNLTAAGHGDSNPVASNKTAEGRAKNRRVEVIVK
ncbi:MAG: OmpA family protein [Nitrospira sp.]|nr:OmpA family protein [Nitrospira sp.]